MSLLDEINKQTQLPMPRKPAKFEAIETSSDDEISSPIILNKFIKAKNPDLYCTLPGEFDYRQSNVNNDLNEFEITSSILEMNGGNSHSNTVIEQRWKARVNQKQLQLQNEENKNITEEAKNSVEKPTKTSQNAQFKNNVLMRHLLRHKTAELGEQSSASSSSQGGKPIENNLAINNAMLTAHVDDPDIFLLRDTTQIPKTVDDGFRFKHRGIKKIVTPRQYLIYEVDDDDFVFINKS